MPSCLTRQSAHIVIVVFSLVMTVMLAALLADGRSMFTYDTDSTTAESLTVVIGTRYGLGTFHDSNGRGWGESSNLVEMLGCDHHKHRFNLLKACCIIAVVFSYFSAFLSLLAAVSYTRACGLASLVCNVLLCTMLVISMSAGWALYSESYSCDDVSIKLKDSFEVSYGPIFLTICFLLGLLNVMFVSTMGLNEEEAPPPERSTKEEKAPEDAPQQQQPQEDQQRQQEYLRQQQQLLQQQQMHLQQQQLLLQQQLRQQQQQTPPDTQQAGVPLQQLLPETAQTATADAPVRASDYDMRAPRTTPPVPLTEPTSL